MYASNATRNAGTKGASLSSAEAAGAGSPAGGDGKLPSKRKRNPSAELLESIRSEQLYADPEGEDIKEVDCGNDDDDDDYYEEGMPFSPNKQPLSKRQLSKKQSKKKPSKKPSGEQPSTKTSAPNAKPVLGTTNLMERRKSSTMQPSNVKPSKKKRASDQSSKKKSSTRSSTRASTGASPVPLDLPNSTSQNAQAERVGRKKRQCVKEVKEIERMTREAEKEEDKVEQLGLNLSDDNLTPAALQGAVDEMGIGDSTRMMSYNTRKLREGTNVLLPTSEHALRNQTDTLSEAQLAAIAYKANKRGDDASNAGYTLGGERITNVKGKKVSASASAALLKMYNDGTNGLKQHNADRAVDAKETILYLQDTQGKDESIENIDLRVLNDDEAKAIGVPPGSSWQIGEQPDGVDPNHYIDQLVKYYAGEEKFRAAQRKGGKAPSNLRSGVRASLCNKNTAHGGFTIRRFYKGVEVTGCGSNTHPASRASYVYTARRQKTPFFAP